MFPSKLLMLSKLVQTYKLITMIVHILKQTEAKLHNSSNLHFCHRSKTNNPTHIMPVRPSTASKTLGNSPYGHKRTELQCGFLFPLSNKSFWTATGLQSVHYANWRPYIKQTQKAYKVPTNIMKKCGQPGREETHLRVPPSKNQGTMMLMSWLCPDFFGSSIVDT